jgi:hypothetical protein
LQLVRGVVSVTSYDHVSLSFDAAWVEYEPTYHREDGSERLGSPRRLPIGGFFEETFAS